MKFLGILSIILIMFSCGHQSITNEGQLNNVYKNTFSPSLELEILKMIRIKETKQNQNNLEQKICSVLVFSDTEKDDKCSVIITLMTNIDTCKMTGYSILNNEFIACYLFSDLCGNKLIDKMRLKNLKDTIMNYSNIQKYDPELIYDSPLYLYEIINNDSLKLIKSSFIE